LICVAGGKKKKAKRKFKSRQAGSLSYLRITGPLLLCATWPKPEPPSLPDAVPLPLEGCSAGPAAVPPPATAVGGEPKVTGSDASEPRYCE
jgi:hypothetical protein